MPGPVPFTESTGPGIEEERDRLLLSEDRIFGHFRDPEFHHALGGNLDRLTGLRIPTHARLPIGKYQLPDAGNYEGILCFAIGKGGEIVQELDRRLLRNSRLSSKMVSNLRFRHRLGHAFLPLNNE